MQFSGMSISEPDGSYVVLQSDGKRIRINADDVEEVSPNSKSAMPEGLLDNLTASEINNLFAYLLGEPEQTASQETDAPMVSQSEFAPAR